MLARWPTISYHSEDSFQPEEVSNMEGDAYFVALTLEADNNENGLMMFPAGEFVEERGDAASREALIEAMKQSVEEEMHRHFTVKAAFVSRCVPFPEPTLCEVEMTYQGVAGANSPQNARKLTRIVERFTIGDDFNLADAFSELRTRAGNRELGSPIAYNFSPVQF